MHALPSIIYDSTKPICLFLQDDTIHEYHILPSYLVLTPPRCNDMAPFFLFL